MSPPSTQSGDENATVRPGGGSGEDIRRVRELLFGEERRHLDELADTIDRVRELHSRQLEEMERRVSLLERSPDTVERHLAAAIHRRDDEENPGRDEFIRALTHPVEESVRRSLSQNPERLGGPVRGVVFGSLGAVGRDWARSLGLDRFAAGAARHRRPLRVAAWSAIALLTGWQPTVTSALIAAPVLGLFGYGISLTLFVWSLRHLGTARTGAYFSVAPFFGAAMALLILAERPGSAFWLAAAMMAIGVWLHVSERHSHVHRHERLVHTHKHSHDKHHQHEHDGETDND